MIINDREKTISRKTRAWNNILWQIIIAKIGNSNLTSVQYNNTIKDNEIEMKGTSVIETVCLTTVIFSEIDTAEKFCHISVLSFVN